MSSTVKVAPGAAVSLDEPCSSPLAAGPRWVVTMGAAPDGVFEVRNMVTHRNFHARRLGRALDELVFGIVSAAKTLTRQL